MDQNQINLVKNSFNEMKPQADKLVDLFYGNLFKNAPNFIPLFPSDMTEQKKKLIAALVAVVTSLDNLEKILPVIEDLGRKHTQKFGVKPEDYNVVGGSLIQSMQTLMGEKFTKEVENAWETAYGILASVMIKA